MTHRWGSGPPLVPTSLQVQPQPLAKARAFTSLAPSRGGKSYVAATRRAGWGGEWEDRKRSLPTCPPPTTKGHNPISPLLLLAP